MIEIRRTRCARVIVRSDIRSFRTDFKRAPPVPLAIRGEALTGILTGLLIGIAITVAFLKEPLRGFWNLSRARQKLGSALSLGLRGQLGDLATFFNYRLDVFVVNYFLGPADVGIYTIGVIVSESIWQIPQAAAVALFPRTARTLDQGASEFTCLVSRQVLLIAFLLGVAMALTSSILIPTLFGARFRPAVAVIWWILPGTIALTDSFRTQNGGNPGWNPLGLPRLARVKRESRSIKDRWAR